MDGVENAAETLPLAVNAAGDEGAFGGEGGSGIVAFGAASGIALRDGGVSGAPKDAGSAGGTASAFGGVGGSTASFWMAGAFFGENGGVRTRNGGAGSGARACGVGSAARGGAGAGARGAGAEAAGVGGDADRSARTSGLGTGGGHAAPLVVTGVFVFDIIGFTPAGVGLRLGTRGATVGWRSSPQLTAAPTGMRPPQIEQRARIETLVILAGSSRKTERHSGQDTFIGSAGLAVSGSRAVVGPA